MIFTFEKPVCGLRFLQVDAESEFAKGERVSFVGFVVKNKQFFESSVFEVREVNRLVSKTGTSKQIVLSKLYSRPVEDAEIEIYK
jgi:hypothetical protein